ncbi:MAG: DNA helicase UvrD, partial [Parcubacteria group bacterium]|nr:DNA helicase UvrD [Parcubacteria group bacterium]
MHYIADFHLHSRYSRACSKSLTLENIEKWCQYKGIQIVGTADFTYPAWNQEINAKLEEVSPGLFRLKGSSSAVRFVITTEISFIYKQSDKTRRVHLCVLVPSLASMNKITDKLGSIGNIKSDGRPIFGMNCRDFTALVLEIDPKCLVIPAHAWTPWFSVFGSKSGFDSLEECFGDMAPHIYAIEKGLSASMEMNWMWSKLDHLTILADSDAHSLENLGREANVFDLENPSYNEIYNIIKNRDTQRLVLSINFFPEEGKYHLDGHAVCGVRLKPAETKKNKGICPVCGKPLTIGVLYRVSEVADREFGKRPSSYIPFKSIIPLKLIIGEALGKGPASKTVDKEYMTLVTKGGSEFAVLLDLSEEELLKITLPKITEGIIKVRKRDIVIEGGYDGLYGTVRI